MRKIHTRASARALGLGCTLLVLSMAGAILAPAAAYAKSTPARMTPIYVESTAARMALLGTSVLAAVTSTNEGAASLESAATKAGETGRKVAMSLIALGFAIASIVLAFRRDFKEAAGIFAIGLVAILLATPAGVNVLHDTVNSLFGAS
jgi:hypothetical protein